MNMMMQFFLHLGFVHFSSFTVLCFLSIYAGIVFLFVLLLYLGGIEGLVHILILFFVIQGVDYLKYDNCFNLGIDPEERLVFCLFSYLGISGFI